MTGTGGAESAGGSGGSGEPDAGDADAAMVADLEEGPGQFVEDFETSDEFFTRTSGRVEGLTESPHGRVQIFYSKNIEPVIDEPVFTVPAGTVAIKTQDSGDGELTAIMVMIKLAAGADPERADWLYQRRFPNGELDEENLAFCSDCHDGWPDTDRLAGVSLTD